MDIVRASSNLAGCKVLVRALWAQRCVAGVMVSIVAFQAVDPGSIPGHPDVTKPKLLPIPARRFFD